MEYKLEWSVPRRVILIKVSGDVSLDELRQFNTELIAFLNEGTAPTHLISIGNDIRRVPTNLMHIRESISYIQHPHIGWTIIVQEKPNPLTSFFVSVAMQATGMKLRQVKTLNDALTTLQRIDQTLRDVSPP